MLTFKSSSDLDKLSSLHSALPLVMEMLKQVGPECGYIVLIEEGDIDIDLPELRCPLADIPWDGAIKLGHYFHAVHLTNNQFGIGFLIPDAPWVTGKLRTCLEEQVR
ncbi:MAG: hypothetical protein AB1593_03960 [Pseudomonadota bacterium]